MYGTLHTTDLLGYGLLDTLCSLPPVARTMLGVVSVGGTLHSRSLQLGEQPLQCNLEQVLGTQQAPGCESREVTLVPSTPLLMSYHQPMPWPAVSI